MKYNTAVLTERAVLIHFKQLSQVFNYLSFCNDYIKKRILSELINPKNLIHNSDTILMIQIFYN